MIYFLDFDRTIVESTKALLARGLGVSLRFLVPRCGVTGK